MGIVLRGARLEVKDGNSQLGEDVESKDKMLSKAIKGGQEAYNAQQPKLNSCQVCPSNNSMQLIETLERETRRRHCAVLLLLPGTRLSNI